MVGSKILLVEDDIFLRDVYVETLTAEGFAVTTAEDGEIALAKFGEDTWDLVLLDLMLPKLDGFQVLKKAKELGTITQAKKVVILTNNTLSNLDNMQEVLELSSEYLIKSEMTPQQFIEKVKSFLTP